AAPLFNASAATHSTTIDFRGAISNIRPRLRIRCELPDRKPKRYLLLFFFHFSRQPWAARTSALSIPLDHEPQSAWVEADVNADLGASGDGLCYDTAARHKKSCFPKK
ncbi:MAG: hypothetical protein ABI619_14470, partial [Betaproteobacteria bacterium]